VEETHHEIMNFLFALALAALRRRRAGAADARRSWG
jgi:hypothetical protein